MAASRPTGTAKAVAQPTTLRVPTMALASPPPSVALGGGGSSVKNSQSSESAPLTSRYDRITTSRPMVMNTHAPSTAVMTALAARAETSPGRTSGGPEPPPLGGFATTPSMLTGGAGPSSGGAGRPGQAG